MSGFLMFVILAVATDTRAVGEAAAIAIGGTIGLDAMFGGPISGASMNPARSLAPAVVSGRPARDVALHRCADLGNNRGRARLSVCARRASSTGRHRRACPAGGVRVTRVLFVCVGNSGRSVMAERLFRRLAGGRHMVRSAGSDPGSAAHPQVLEALCEIGIEASDHVPHKLGVGDLDWADIAVSTCSEEVCPVTPGVRRISWEFADPKTLPLEQVRAIRDEIERHEQLVQDLDREAAA